MALRVVAFTERKGWPARPRPSSSVGPRGRASRPEQRALYGIAKRDAASNAAAAAAAGSMPPISITMNLDGKTLSQVLIDRISNAYGNFDTRAPGFGGANSFGP
jgi:hypothetical protein